jgi:hypothetical protein
MALSFVLLLTGSAWAQLSSQTALVGTVTDSGGLVVPGAQVVAVNMGTKDTYETTTNNEGYYDIQFARPGKYEITVTMSGFQTFKATGVGLNTNQVVRTNATLAVGQLTESVTVESTAQVLNTDRATVSETINERAIVELRSPTVTSGALRPRHPVYCRRAPAISARASGAPASARFRTAWRSTASTHRPTCWRRPACGRSPKP